MSYQCLALVARPPSALPCIARGKVPVLFCACFDDLMHWGGGLQTQIPPTSDQSYGRNAVIQCTFVVMCLSMRMYIVMKLVVPTCICSCNLFSTGCKTALQRSCRVFAGFHLGGGGWGAPLNAGHPP